MVVLRQYNLPELINKLSSIYKEQGPEVAMEVYHGDDGYYTALKFFKLKDVYTQKEIRDRFKQEFYDKYPELARKVFKHED